MDNRLKIFPLQERFNPEVNVPLPGNAGVDNFIFVTDKVALAQHYIWDPFGNFPTVMQLSHVNVRTGDFLNSSQMKILPGTRNHDSIASFFGGRVLVLADPNARVLEVLDGFELTSLQRHQDPNLYFVKRCGVKGHFFTTYYEKGKSDFRRWHLMDLLRDPRLERRSNEEVWALFRNPNRRETHAAAVELGLRRGAEKFLRAQLAAWEQTAREAGFYRKGFLQEKLAELGEAQFFIRDSASRVLSNAIDLTSSEWLTTTLLPFLNDNLTHADLEVRLRVQRLLRKASERNLGWDLNGPDARQRWGAEYALSMIRGED